MIEKNDSDEDYEVKRNIISIVYCECNGTANEKFQKQISIHFVLGIEFTCACCGNQVTVKVEAPDEKIVCPACLCCEILLTETFNNILATQNRPTPHRRGSRRASHEQSTKAGRPPLDKVRREYIQLTLHPDTLDALYEMQVNRAALIEFLLNLFPPFVRAIKNRRHL